MIKNKKIVYLADKRKLNLTEKRILNDSSLQYLESILLVIAND
jgi:hypothetical protein